MISVMLARPTSISHVVMLSRMAQSSMKTFGYSTDMTQMAQMTQMVNIDLPVGFSQATQKK